MSHWKDRLTILPLCMAALLLGLACSKDEQEKKAPEKAEGQPKIQAVQAQFDFGKVKQGVDVEHVFKMKNIGAKDLFIEKARGS